MDIKKESSQATGPAQPPTDSSEKKKQSGSLRIRTMTEDIAKAKKQGPVSESSLPPTNLPTDETEKTTERPKKAEKTPLTSEPIKAKQKPKTKKSKSNETLLIVVGGILFSLILAVGAFAYWWNFLRSESKPTHYECQNNQCVQVEGEGDSFCSQNSDCLPEEPEKPKSLILADSEQTINVAIGEKHFIKEELASLAESQEKNHLERILIKLSGTQEIKYADLETFFSAMEITPPPLLERNLSEEENYTLFLYKKEEKGHLGIAIELQEDSRIASALKKWEQEMKQEFRPLLLAEEVPDAFTENFQSNTEAYPNIEIRYLNFDNPKLALDYALVDNYLIITTSRDSMYEAIDRIKEKTTAQKIDSNCGIVENTHIFVSPEEMTTQEEESLSCINRALLDCSPAIIKFSGKEESTYKIKKESDNNCLVAKLTNEQEEIKTCEVPLDFIKESSTKAEQENNNKYLFAMTVPFILDENWTAADMKTEEQTNFKCY